MQFKNIIAMRQLIYFSSIFDVSDALYPICGARIALPYSGVTARELLEDLNDSK